MQKVIVTGGAGFIGSHLVNKLTKMDLEVMVLDNLSTGKRKNLDPKAQLIMCDIANTKVEFLIQHIKNADIVFHLAAHPEVQYSIENPTDNNNLNSVINILEASRLSNVKRLIFSSSSSVYGNPNYTPIDEKHPTSPLSPYAIHKLIGEQYCKLYSDIYNLDTVCLRYFNAYGNRMSDKGAYRSVISIFKEQFLTNQPFNIVNDGEQRRDFVHVDDIVKANILCATHSKDFKGEFFNVGIGKGYSVNKIADMFGGKKQYGEKRIEPKNSIANTSKINSKLGWESKDNLKSFINTIKENK